MRLLLVEDDRLLGEGIKDALCAAGYTVDWLTDGREALAALSGERFQVAILDLGLPKLDGRDVLRLCRERGVTLPILVLTARDGIEDRVTGLDNGADDYLIKPFDVDELLARLRALARRAKDPFEPAIEHGSLTVDPRSRHVRYADHEVTLTRREYALLYELLQNRGRILTREQLESTLYGWQDEIESNAVEVHIHHLRKKLSRDLIRNVRGVGYIIERA